MRHRLLPFALCALIACDAAPEGGSSDTDASPADTELGDDASDTSGGAPVEVGTPANVRGADHSACHVAGDLPDSFVYASCAGDPVASVDDPDAYCLEGPQPFGALSLSTDTFGTQLNYCPLEPSEGFFGVAEWFTFAENYPYVLPVAYRVDGGGVSIDALALSASAGGYDFRCRPAEGFGGQEIDYTMPLPVGELSCGAITVVEAVPGQAPIVRVDVGDSPTYLQMVALQ